MKKVLISNRGEIACRLISAAKSIGLQTVAVHSEADSTSRHVKMAHEAHCIGAAPSNESYLNVDRILEACKKADADAVHPGYGFLSERASFAKAVLDQKLIWIGPPPEVIEKMGNKIAAKKIAEKAKVPTLPWAILEEGWTVQSLKKSALKVGFPLLLKAANGGGGRGMRLVECESELEEKAHSAIREAEGAFGSGELFLESYCPIARHIEVQIIGDQHGQVFSLGERECSVQRRHQKVIEEAPSPSISAKTRKDICAAAVRLAQSVGYVNAGTCEFLVDPQENFYFLEMNTRLQVEHPVTEMVWGVDLPILQYQVAQGQKLPVSLSKLASRGHAIEVRIYAEDPSENFRPSPGVIHTLKWPLLPYLRADVGYEANDEVPIFYDAMIAKLIAWGMDRESARKNLIAALRSTEIEGIAWNGEFLEAILGHPDFIKGDVSTSFLKEKFGNWKGQRKKSIPRTRPIAQALPEVHPSPWAYYGEDVENTFLSAGTSNDQSSPASTDFDYNPLKADYPGKVLKINAHAGQTVEAGDVLVVCESMKMEFSYSAPAQASIKNICVDAGQTISAGTVLIEWEKPNAS